MKGENVARGALVAIGVSMLVACAVNRDEANRPKRPLDYYMGEPLEITMETRQTESETETETETEIENTLPRYIEDTETACETTTAAETATETESVQITTEAETEPYSAEYAFTLDEMLLMRVASCEAGYTGDAMLMAYIMMTIKNRVADPAYPGSVWDVISAPQQYSCIYSDLWESGYIAPGAVEALSLIYRGQVNDMGATFYCTPARNAWHRSHLTYLYTHGNAEFFK